VKGVKKFTNLADSILGWHYFFFVAKNVREPGVVLKTDVFKMRGRAGGMD
jgi:hypothetical protein